MAESSLNTQLSELQSDLGDYLGTGRGEDFGDRAWLANEVAEITGSIKSGLRRFYFQAQIQGMTSPHSWSFLKPVGTVILADGATEANMPDDFGGLEERLYITSSNGSTIPFEACNPAAITQRYAGDPDGTGFPEMVGVEAIKGTTVVKSNRYKLVVYPAADEAYTFSFPYFILPDYLTNAHPFAYGGALHAETIRAACFAAAERERNDTPGPREAYYQQCLAASIGADRRMKPSFVGYNRDLSDARMMGDGLYRMRNYDRITVTYAGS